MRLPFASSSARMLSWLGSRCCTSTKAMPVSIGSAPRSCLNASSPPAEAPTPTMGKALWGGRAWTSSCSPATGSGAASGEGASGGSADRVVRGPSRRDDGGLLAIKGPAPRAGQERRLRHQLCRHHGLGNLLVEAGRQSPLTMRRARVGGERQRRDPAPFFRFESSDLADELQAILARQADVADEQVRSRASHGLHRLPGRRRRGHPGAAPLEDQLQHLPAVGVVFHDQQPHPLERFPVTHRPGPLRPRSPGRNGTAVPGLCGKRKRHGNGRALALARAIHVDRPPVELHQLLDDGQPEPEPALHAPRRAVLLAESLEHVREEVTRDALSGVAHPNMKGITDPSDPDLDPPAPRSELHRVRQHVPDDLLQTVRVAVDERPPCVRRQLEADPLGLGRGTDGLDRGARHRHEVHQPR